MASGRSDIIDIAATVKHETDKAFLLDVGMDEPIWFPKAAPQTITMGMKG